MNDASATAAPTTRALRRAGRRPRQPPARDHRPARGRPPADGERGRLGLADRLQRRALQLPRAAADARGARPPFHSRTDTEVILHAYEEWGPRLPRALQRDVRVRDLGRAQARALPRARPLRGQAALLRAHDGAAAVRLRDQGAPRRAGVPRRVSPEALVEYFTFQNILSDRTLFEASGCSRPGTCSVSRRRRASRRARYWDLCLRARRRRLRGEWAERSARRFEEAVTRQLVSDVPVGSYLSGGMDSGSIAAVAAARRPHLMTFTGGFDLASVTGIELVFDERADAEVVAAIRTEHYEMVMHAGDMAWVLPELVWHLEDLRVGMCYQNYYIARLASKFVKVALAGTGGDELFAGYPWRYELVAGRDDRRASSDATTSTGAGSCPTPRSRRFFSPRSGRRRRRRARLRGLPRRARAWRAEPRPGRRRALYFEAKTFLHGLLVVEDKVSMAHSLEARVPFLDNELVDARRADPGAAASTARRAASALLREGDARRSSRTRSSPSASRASARRTSPGTAGRRWTTSASSCSTSARSGRGLLPARSTCSACSRSTRGPRQPPPPDLVAALLRVVEPPLPRRVRPRCPSRSGVPARAGLMPALLAETFACPRCGGALRAEDDKLVCSSCESAFPVLGGIPRFVETAPGSAAQVQRVFDFEHRRYRDSQHAQFHPRLINQFLLECGLPREFFAGKRALDAGCGSGRWTYALAELGAEVTAVDLTAGGPEVRSLCFGRA